MQTSEIPGKPATPFVAVLDHKRVPGLSSMAKQAGHYALDQLPLAEALGREYETDAHFVTYTVPSETGEPERLPRLNKPILAELREQGHDVVCSMLVLDYDNAGHAGCCWTTLRFFARRKTTASRAKSCWSSPRESRRWRVAMVRLIRLNSCRKSMPKGAIGPVGKEGAV